jgi:hypothetical protein
MRNYQAPRGVGRESGIRRPGRKYSNKLTDSLLLRTGGLSFLQVAAGAFITSTLSVINFSCVSRVIVYILDV